MEVKLFEEELESLLAVRTRNVILVLRTSEIVLPDRASWNGGRGDSEDLPGVSVRKGASLNDVQTWRFFVVVIGPCINLVFEQIADGA